MTDPTTAEPAALGALTAVEIRADIMQRAERDAPTPGHPRHCSCGQCIHVRMNRAREELAALDGPDPGPYTAEQEAADRALVGFATAVGGTPREIVVALDEPGTGGGPTQHELDEYIIDALCRLRPCGRQTYHGPHRWLHTAPTGALRWWCVGVRDEQPAPAPSPGTVLGEEARRAIEMTLWVEVSDGRVPATAARVMEALNPIVADLVAGVTAERDRWRSDWEQTHAALVAAGEEQARLTALVRDAEQRGAQKERERWESGVCSICKTPYCGGGCEQDEMRAAADPEPEWMEGR